MSPISLAAFLTKSSQLSVRTLLICLCASNCGCFVFAYSALKDGSLQNKHLQDCSSVVVLMLERVLLDGTSELSESFFLRFFFAADSSALKL